MLAHNLASPGALFIRAGFVHDGSVSFSGGRIEPLIECSFNNLNYSLVIRNFIPDGKSGCIKTVFDLRRGRQLERRSPVLHEQTVDGIRVLEMDDGKVNFLNLTMRRDLLSALQSAERDGAVKAIVLLGRGACFCAGMNVEDFEYGTALTSPSLHGEILDTLAASAIPVVAAIHGGAHGGGLELALGCHYRVAKSDTRLSLPEVLVGLMPGARGTQHLPRAIGLEAAADMILNGRVVQADSAPGGLVDHVVADDLLDGAIEFAKGVAEQRPVPRLQDKTVVDIETDLYELMNPQHADFPGISSAISLLKASHSLPFAQAIEQEFLAFVELKDSEACKPFIEAFLARLKATSAAKRH